MGKGAHMICNEWKSASLGGGGAHMICNEWKSASLGGGGAHMICNEWKSASLERREALGWSVCPRKPLNMLKIWASIFQDSSKSPDGLEGEVRRSAVFT